MIRDGLALFSIADAFGMNSSENHRCRRPGIPGDVVLTATATAQLKIRPGYGLGDVFLSVSTKSVINWYGANQRGADSFRVSMTSVRHRSCHGLRVSRREFCG